MSLPSRPLRFLASGGAATALHFSVMALLTALEVGATPATATGALLGALANYRLQYRWTFASTRAHREAVSLFALVAAANWLGNLMIFASLYHLIGLPVPLAQLITTGTLTAVNYRLYDQVVFR